MIFSEAFASNFITGTIPEPVDFQQNIQGKVLDETALPLPGVTVQIKGSS